MTNIVNISQILIKRGNTIAANNYVGPLGELLVDTGQKTLRLQDGATPGGMATLVNTRQLANVISTIEGITTTTANIESILANINAVNLSSITSNVSSLQQQLSITGTANIGTLNTNLINFTNSNGQIVTGQVGPPNTSWIEMTANIHHDISGFYADENAAMQIYSAQDIVFIANTVGSAPQWTFGEDGNTTLPATTGRMLFPYNENSNAIIDYSQDIGQYFIIQNNLADGHQGINLDTDDAQVTISSKNSGGYPLRTWNFDWQGQMRFPDNTVQTSAYQGPAGQTDFATQANVTIANTAMKGYVDSSINNLVNNAPAILDTLGEIAANLQADESSLTRVILGQTAANTQISTLQANIGSYYIWANANTAGLYSSILGANTAWTANAATQQGLITNLQANIGGFYTWANTNFGTSSYANANVAAYLPTYAGQLGAGNSTVTGTVIANKFQTSATAPNGGSYIVDNGGSLFLSPNSAISNTGVQIGGSGYIIGPNGSRNITLNYNSVNGQVGVPQLNVYSGGITNGGTSNVANIGSSTTWFGNAFVNSITAGNFLYANGVSILTGISAGAGTYSNTNVSAYLTTATINTTGNITAGNLTTSGTYTVANITTTGAYGNITGANVISANSVTVSTGIFWANGTAWSSGSGGGTTYSNANVAAYLAAGTDPTIYSNANVVSYFNANSQYTFGNAAATVTTQSNAVSILVGNTTGIHSGFGFVQPNSTVITNNIYANVAGTFVYRVGGVGAATVTLNNGGIYFAGTATGGTAGNPVSTGALMSLIPGSGAYIYTPIVLSSTATSIQGSGLGSTTFSILTSGVNTLNIVSAAYTVNMGAANVTLNLGSNTGNISAGNISATQYGNSFGTTATYSGNVTVGNLVATGNVYGQNFVGNIITSANITASYFITSGTYGNISQVNTIFANNYVYANGVSILSGISAGAGTYSNANVAAYLTTASIITTGNITAGNITMTGTSYPGNIITANITAGNVTAGYFYGNGVGLTGITYNQIGNIYGSSSNVTLQAGSYSWTFDNTGNLSIPTNGNIIWANGTVFSSGSSSGGGSGTLYTNANVVSMLAANTAVFIGNVGNVATVSPIQSNITQLFVGNSTTLTSGNAATPTSTFLMYNAYFAPNGAILTRNTTTGVGYVEIDSTGIGFSGYTGAVTANTVPTFNQFLRMNGSIGAQFSGAVTSGGLVTGVGLTSTNGLTLNTLGQISTNQTSASIFAATATSISIGATTSTVTTGGNLFSGNNLGVSTGNLTLRAQGNWNVLTVFGVAGGYNSPPYSNQALTGGSGTGMTANYSSVGGYISTITVSNPGSGYKNGDILTVPGGLGSTVILSNYNSSIAGTLGGASSFTFTMDGNLILPGNVTYASNAVIYGDFTNSTVNNRTIFRPFAANSNPGIYAAPTGTGTAASWQAANSNDLTNTSKILIATNGTTDVQLVSGINGTGTYLPLSFLTSGTTQMQLGTGGNLNMVTGGNIATTGNVIAGNIIGNQYGNSIGTTATYSGNVTVGGNIVTTGATSGNISGANYVSANVLVANANVIVGGSLFVSGASSNIIVKTGGIVAQNVIVAMDNIRVQWYNLAAGGSQNALQIASQTGTPSLLMTYYSQSGLGGSPSGGVVNTTLNTTFANLLPAASGVAGDSYDFTGTIGSNAYRISAMTGAGYNNNLLVIERLA